MPIDIDLLNTLQRTITGDWEYLCVPTAPPTFEGGQTARGGRLRFDVHVTPLGLSVIVEGQRQWGSAALPGAPPVPVKLSYPIEWSGRGSIFDEDGKKILRYTFGDNLTDSETVDCFVISEH